MKYELTSKQKKYLPIKRVLDLIICIPLGIMLAPVMGVFAVAIKIDSPGPILFKQKRVGIDKAFFEIWKFRTMRTDTPKDMPTHLLINPDQFITRIGKFMRQYSIDELPQIYQCLFGTLTLVGPRPALWNQDDLVSEREKYGANSIKPGITGWAQINGRDELEILDKAFFDGEYVKEFGFIMDIKCILGTIGSVLSHDGVVEGGTGNLHKQDLDSSVVVPSAKIKKRIAIGGAVLVSIVTVGILVLKAIVNHVTNKKTNRIVLKKKNRFCLILGVATIGGVVYTAYVNAKRKVMLQDNLVNDQVEDDMQVSDDSEIMKTHDHIVAADKAVLPKKVLITGANSYIGLSVEDWLSHSPDKYIVDTLNMIDDSWKEHDFSKYDVVYHVAGIAHADTGKVTEEQKQLYYKVNTDLTVEVAEKAKREGVKQFIFMSSMIVYSGCKVKVITTETQPQPLNFYGDSKWQADQKVRELSDDSFKVVVLRPPMVYGKGSRGNYPQLAKLAKKLPVFPIVMNKRSMLHIDNLCQFIKLIIDNEEVGVFFPQNGEYTNTSDMVQMIAEIANHRIIMIPGTALVIKALEKIPGKAGSMATKAFGDSAYSMEMSEYKEDYRVNSLRQSIYLTEGNKLGD